MKTSNIDELDLQWMRLWGDDERDFEEVKDRE